MARTDPRPNYGSKRRVRPDGYVDLYRPGHPLARTDGYVFEHRFVMWEAGRLTDPEMQVHHRNGDRTDNRLPNLAVVSIDVHTREHQEARGHVTNQHGTFPVKPVADRASSKYPSAGFVKSERPCEGCDGVISATRRADARYCSKACTARAWHMSRVNR